MRTAHLVRAAATAASGALVAGLLGAPAQAAEPAPSAASWLAGQLQGGLLTYESYGSSYTDVGLSIDAGLAFAALGQTAQLNAVRDGVAAKVDGYAYSDEYAFEEPYEFVQTGYYAGQIGKAMVLAQAAGVDSRTYGGGINLAAKLEELTTDSGPSKGRGVSDSSYGDYTGTVSQAFIARALTGVGSAEAGNATSYLLQQQCSAGYFRQDFTADMSAANQSCVDGDQTTSAPSVDVTALTVQQLQSMPTKDAAVNGAIQRALAWLKSVQAADGSLAAGDTAADSNGTGLAAQVLARAGECLAAGRAASWVRALQVPAGTAGALGADAGAVAYNKAAYDAAGGGIASTHRGQWLRATAQAAAGLRATLSPTLTALEAPTGYVRAGTTQTLTATGLAAGDNVCFTDAEGVVSTLPATTAGATATVTLPSGTGSTTYKATVAGIEKQATIERLGALAIKPKAAKKKVRKGQRQRIVVKGLAAGEKVVVRVNGKRVKKSTASDTGRFVAEFTMTKKLARKKKAKVTVVGEFRDIRRGTATFRVVKRKARR